MNARNKGGYIEDQYRPSGTYLKRLRCDRCECDLIAAELSEGEGKCECGRRYDVMRGQRAVAWIDKP